MSTSGRACGRRAPPWDFFFQAEDGIRDGRVTGVQTCALPISDARAPARLAWLADIAVTIDRNEGFPGGLVSRSEERRVGKSVKLGGGRNWNRKNACLVLSVAEGSERAVRRTVEIALALRTNSE